ncbi:hypothetical protein, partial [Pseudonocardia sulfidoxydans]|uniref:hypothetical protein n=1 Tax=Pseudonocardia sulfidoxydans TaxID=54011 RepID=UPI0011BF304C
MNKNLLRGAYVAAMSGGLLLLANTAAHADENHNEAHKTTGDDIASTATFDKNDLRYHHTNARSHSADPKTERNRGGDSDGTRGDGHGQRGGNGGGQS